MNPNPPNSHLGLPRSAEIVADLSPTVTSAKDHIISTYPTFFQPSAEDVTPLGGAYVFPSSGLGFVPPFLEQSIGREWNTPLPSLSRFTDQMNTGGGTLTFSDPETRESQGVVELTAGPATIERSKDREGLPSLYQIIQGNGGPAATQSVVGGIFLGVGGSLMAAAVVDCLHFIDKRRD